MNLEVLKNLKYYRHEAENPYKGTDRNAATWWEGERALVDLVNKNPEYLDKLETLYNEAFSHKKLRGKLANGELPKVERLIVFFLDLWHGKNYPYDNLDDIEKY